MKILDRYILKEYIYSFIGVLLICAVVLLVYMLIESYEDILENEPGLKYVVLYFLNSMPFHLIQIVPMAVAVAILFTIGSMARHNELVAIVAAGISTRRIALPILAATFIISLLSLFFSEMIVPGCQERATYIEKIYIEGEGQAILSRNREIFVKGEGQRFYVMDAFDNETKVMTNPTVIDLCEDGSTIRMRIDADQGELVEERGEQGRFWKFVNARRYVYDESGHLQNYESFSDPITLAMEEDLDKFLSNRKKPEEMNFFELKNYINILEKRGESVGFYKTDLHLKIAFPFASFIIALLCYSFAVRLESRNLILGYAFGVIAAIAYYAITAVSQALGHQFIFPPAVAGWSSNVLFAVIGMIYLHRLSL